MRLHGEIKSLSGQPHYFLVLLSPDDFYDNEDIGDPQMGMLKQMVKAQQIQTALYLKIKVVFYPDKSCFNLPPPQHAIKNIVIVHGGVKRKSVSANEIIILLVHWYRSPWQRDTFSNQQQIFTTHPNMHFISFGQFQKIGSIWIVALKEFW